MSGTFEIRASTIREMQAHAEARELEAREEALIDEVVKYLDGNPAHRRLVAKELIAMVRATAPGD